MMQSWHISVQFPLLLQYKIISLSFVSLYFSQSRFWSHSLSNLDMQPVSVYLDNHSQWPTHQQLTKNMHLLKRSVC